MAKSISVILPVYNVAEYIAECIQSLLAQTIKDFELIIVDDCGQDDSIAITHQLLDGNTAFPTKWIRHEKNRGLSAGRNTGMEHAEGEYVFFLDSDDYITPDCLERQLKAIKKYDADIVVGGIEILGTAGSVPRLSIDKDYIEGKAILEKYLCSGYYMMAWNKLVRRSFLIENNISFVEGLIHEDEPWSFEVACVAKKMALVHEPTYIYRIRENSIQTDKAFNKHYVAYKRVFQTIADTAKRYNVMSNPLFQWWFDRRLALLFQQTQMSGTADQAKEIYGLIRALHPIYRMDKTHIHNYFPKSLGILLYRRFYKHLLC